jgi:hypothetical protein
MNQRLLPLSEQTERLRIDFIKAELESELSLIQSERAGEDLPEHRPPEQALHDAIQTYRTALRFMALSDDALTEQDERIMLASLELLGAEIKDRDPNIRI